MVIYCPSLTCVKAMLHCKANPQQIDSSMTGRVSCESPGIYRCHRISRLQWRFTSGFPLRLQGAWRFTSDFPFKPTVFWRFQGTWRWESNSIPLRPLTRLPSTRNSSPPWTPPEASAPAGRNSPRAGEAPTESKRQRFALSEQWNTFGCGSKPMAPFWGGAPPILVYL